MGSTEARNGSEKDERVAVVCSSAVEDEGGGRISVGGGGRRPWARTVQAEKEKAKGIRWERPRNCRLNGKTERNRRDERDIVLTFGQ
jgi:hypothetical protein